MSALRAAWRLLNVGVQLAGGLVICATVFPFIGAGQRLQHVGRWSRRTLRALGIGLVAKGTVHPGATLFVANHVSWLDILAINAVQPVRFVSKADVRAWPVLGWLVECGGTLFIERERKRDALRVVHLVAEALRAGEKIAVFPEGTTSVGHAVLPFHANLLQAAIATETPVQPVVLRFADAREPVSPAAAFIGEQTLAASLWAVLNAKGMVAHVELLPAQGTRHLDRRALAAKLQGEIAAALDAGLAR